MYGAGILGAEYASGLLLRGFVGHVPWNYGDARFSVDGLIRIDYFPLWAAFGLGLERLHDALVCKPVEGAFGRRRGHSRAPPVSSGPLR